MGEYMGRVDLQSLFDHHLPRFTDKNENSCRFPRMLLGSWALFASRRRNQPIRHELYFLPWHSHIQFVTNRLRVPILTISVVQNWKQLQAGLWAIDVTRRKQLGGFATAATSAYQERAT